MHLQTLSNLSVGAGTSCHLVVGLSKTYVQMRFEPAAGGELEHSTFVRRVAEQVKRSGPAFMIRDYFKPSFFPAASRRIDSRMRLSRVSGRFAV